MKCTVLNCPRTPLRSKSLCGLHFVWFKHRKERPGCRCSICQCGKREYVEMKRAFARAAE